MIKVLLIEDEEIVARMYEKAFQFEGFATTIALGGKEGLAKAKKEKPDIILLDIMMPKPDGMEVLEKLKSDSQLKDIPVVMLTNLSGKQESELALSKGACEYWLKCDIDIKEIGKRIRKIVNDGKTQKPQS